MLNRNGIKGLQKEDLMKSGMKGKDAKALIKAADELSGSPNGTIDDISELRHALTTYTSSHPLNIQLVKDGKPINVSMHWDGKSVRISKAPKFRELDPSEQLHINTDPNSHYRIKKTRQQGELELWGLIDRGAKVEESWAYVRGTLKDGTQVEYWYEIGTDESNETVTSSLNFKDISSDFASVKEISLYHIHPKDQSKNPRKSESPSYKDYYQAIAFAFYLKDHNVKYDNRIITPKGKYTFTIDLSKKSPETRVLTATGFAEDRTSFLRNRIPLQDFCQKISNDFIKLDYSSR